MIILVLYLMVAFGVAAYMYYEAAKIQAKGNEQGAVNYINSLYDDLDISLRQPDDIFSGGKNMHSLIWVSAIIWPVNAIVVVVILIRKLARRS